MVSSSTRNIVPRMKVKGLYSKVNMNITVDQGVTSLNMRVFDCMACGSFLLSVHKADFEELFDYENEVVTYRRASEVPELVRYYLDHEEERKEISKRARRRVLAEHSYQNRVEFVLGKLESGGAFEPPRWWDQMGDPAKRLDSLVGLTEERSAVLDGEAQADGEPGVAGAGVPAGKEGL